jgi:tetratricopeptide (TPR) repeat protein
MCDVIAGLAAEPANAHLLCLRGRLLAGRGDAIAARESVLAALVADPSLAEAWAIKGELAYEAGDLLASVADFDHAVRLSAVPEIRFNRAVACEALGRFREAAEDYDAVWTATADPDAALRRDACLRAATECMAAKAAS